MSQAFSTGNIRIVFFAPGYRAIPLDINGDVKTMRHLVDGPILMLRPFEKSPDRSLKDVVLICNIYAKQEQLLDNRLIEGEQILGNFFISYFPSGNSSLISLPESMEKKLTEKYYLPEIHVKIGNKTYAVPYDPPYYDMPETIRTIHLPELI